MEPILNFIADTGFYQFFQAGGWKNLVMIAIACVLLYLGVHKKYEPLLMCTIAFGMLLTNLPGANMYHEIFFAGGHIHWDLIGGAPITQEFLTEMAGMGVAEEVLTSVAVGQSISAGLVDILYLGIKLGIYPCLIFMGVGAMTDFGPLIANPKSLLLGAAAQLGIFMTYVGCRLSGMFSPAQAGSIGIIGGADGPTAIFVTTHLAPELLGPIAVAAYSYMALVPVIQPPIMKLLTTKEERQIVMKPLREVSKTEKIVFPIMVAIFVSLLVPSAAPLIICLMLGNLFRESGVMDRLSKTAQNELINIVTIFLGVSVGSTATAATFLSPKTLMILVMGIVAFGFGTAGGVILAKIMNLFLKEKINPLIGSAGVSAVPMAARVSQMVGQKENPRNFLLMHAMGPNVAGVIGSAIAAGVLMSLFG
ncbi:sodium ion-translocating decarboxylase subunit beta [Oscillibacter sp.]|jgi:sodium ion-translocating decarboxylase beta subunit|uniref:sodium ion-translocating decarboxylase subunit beta n=2 Tax=Oscillibacter sp. TaxID=1945593 RepID=UPI002171884B|nr:sodium ion-translocating decarboxylase subunit beta [Oscillibacter sp.]MCI9648777.1 sodium ion-translocating decarboxylase subunit beta [Oscillibacter sp.]